MIAPGSVESDRPHPLGDSNGKHGGMASGLGSVETIEQPDQRVMLDGADVLWTCSFVTPDPGALICRVQSGRSTASITGTIARAPA
jgi:hypothetical protein